MLSTAPAAGGGGDTRTVDGPGRSGSEDEADLAIVGAGGAGLAVLHALAHRDLTVGLPREVRVVVLDPVPADDDVSRHRTWCFWARGPQSVAPAVQASWRHVRVSDERRDLLLDLDPYRYHLVRAVDLTALVADEVDRAPRLHVERVQVAVDRVDSCADHAHVRWSTGALRARLVLDSRPVPPERPGAVWWWQHFRGWTLPAGSLPGGVAPAARLMDFRTVQPRTGLSFGYVLPLPDGRALVEYTEFSPTRLDDAGYDSALRGYLDLLGAPDAVVAEHVETGAIPMTDGAFARRCGARVLRIGTAGGATRGSTGYTFAAMLRHGRGVADLVAGGALERPGRLVLPPAYPARHRWMDAVMLQALDAGLVAGPAFFTGLFAAQPPGRVLRFLDGRSSPLEELAVMAASPTMPMARASGRDLQARLRGRRRGSSGSDPVRASAVPVSTVGLREVAAAPDGG